MLKQLVTKQLTKYRSMPLAVKASLWFMVCSVLQKCITFFTLPLFTRLLTTEQYGMLSIYQSWAGIAAIFTTLNLQYGSLNRAFIKYEDDREGYMSSVQGIATMTTGIAIGIYLVFQGFINPFTSMSSLLTITMFLEILFVMPLNLWAARQRFDYKYRILVIITLMQSLITPLIGLIAVCNLSDRGVVRIVSFAAVNILIGLFFYTYNLLKGKKLFNRKYWSFALKFNIPLIPYYLSQTVFNVSDKLMINWLVGKAEAGIYGVAYQMAMILNFVLNAVNNSFVPWMYQHIRDKKEKEIARVANGILLLWATLLLLLMLFTPEIIYLMAGSNYMDAIWVMPPVSASMLFLFLTQMSANFEFYYEKNNYLVIGAVGSAVLNLLLNYICIPIFGYVAAGYTTLVSYIIFWLMNYMLMRRVFVQNGVRVEDVNDIRFQGMVSIAFLVATFGILATYRIRLLRYGIIAAIIIFVIIKRKWAIKKVKSTIQFK